MHLISKMQPVKNGEGGSRLAIVLNGSPLFTGAAGSGESNIRQWIIENDLLDAIIALPTDMFYNTGIATYIWILDNNKPAKRKGKVQLINAVDMYGRRSKSLGSKRKNCARRTSSGSATCTTASETSRRPMNTTHTRRP